MKEYKRILNLKIGAMIPLLLVSIFAIVIKSMSLQVLAYLFGGCIIMESVLLLYAYVIQKKGTYKVFNLDLLFVVLLFILGTFMLINPNTTKLDLVILVGVYYIIKAIYKLSVPLYTNLGTQINTMVIIDMIISIALALVMFIYPFEFALFTTRTIGLFTIVSFALDLIYIRLLNEKAKEIVGKQKKNKGKK